jgi:hypothetical protein
MKRLENQRVIDVYGLKVEGFIFEEFIERMEGDMGMEVISVEIE